jgi:quinol monooxygenase YgiN
MTKDNPAHEGPCMHIVTLDCKDEAHAKRCMDALANYGRPDALAFNCVSYDFGLKEGTTNTVYIIEHWRQWQDLNALLNEKVVPALPMYIQLLKKPFDPSKDTLRIKLSRM